MLVHSAAPVPTKPPLGSGNLVGWVWVMGKGGNVYVITADICPWLNCVLGNFKMLSIGSIPTLQIRWNYFQHFHWFVWFGEFSMLRSVL